MKEIILLNVHIHRLETSQHYAGASKSDTQSVLILLSHVLLLSIISGECVLSNFRE